MGHQREPIHVAQFGRRKEAALCGAFVKQGCAQQRDRQAQEGRQWHSAFAGDEGEFVLHRLHRLRRRIEHQPVLEGDTGLQAGLNGFQLRHHQVLFLLVALQLRFVERLDAAEEAETAGRAHRFEIVGIAKEISGDERNPTLKQSLFPKRADQVELGMEGVLAVAVEVVVDEQHVFLGRDIAQLRFDIAEVVAVIAPAFGGERTEAALEIAVAARLDIADRAAPAGEVEARQDRFGDGPFAENFLDNGLHLLDVTFAGVVEGFGARNRQIADNRSAGDDDAAWRFRAGIGGQMAHPVEGGGDPGQHQHVQFREGRLVDERSVVKFAVGAKAHAITGKGARQEQVAGSLRDEVGATFRISGLVEMRKHD
ncbi:hypothetical protein D9M72_370470 [compost metagenome]